MVLWEVTQVSEMAKRSQGTGIISDLEQHAEEGKKILTKLKEIYQNCINEDDVALRIMKSSSLHHSKQLQEPLKPSELHDLEEDLYLTKYTRNRDSNNGCANRVDSSLKRPWLTAPNISKRMQQYRGDIDFIQAIIWLKSAISSMRNVDVNDFYSHFHNQWKSIRSKPAFEHGENTDAGQNNCSRYSRMRKDIEKHESTVSVSLISTCPRINRKEENVFNDLASSPQRFKGYGMQLNSPETKATIPETLSISSSYSGLFDNDDLNVSDSAIFEVQTNDNCTKSDLHNISLDEANLNLTRNSHSCLEANDSFLSRKTVSLLNEERYDNSQNVEIASLTGRDLCSLPMLNSLCSFNFKSVDEKSSEPSFNCDKASCLQNDSGFSTLIFGPWNLPEKEVTEPPKKRIAKDINCHNLIDDSNNTPFHDGSKRLSDRTSNSHQNSNRSGDAILDNTKYASQEKINKQKNMHLPSAWLRFNFDTLNVNEFVLKSIEVILSHFENEEIAVPYMKLKYWDNTLEKEALNAILGFCEIFETKSNTDKCSQQIYLTVVKVLSKIESNIEENKITLLRHHISILLEFCACKNVCVRTINYLIEKLKSFEALPSSINNNAFANSYSAMNRLRLLFYALNICIKKYLLILPENTETSEEYIQIIELWKKEAFNRQNIVTVESMELRERRWMEVLEKFAVICSEDFKLFAKQAYNLMHLLNSKLK